MKKFYFIFHLFFMGALKAQDHLPGREELYNIYHCEKGYYITKNSDTVKTKIYFLDQVGIQNRVFIMDSLGSIHSLKPGEISSFSFKNRRYDSVERNGYFMFLENVIDGRVLKSYRKLYITPNRHLAHYTPVLCKNGVEIIKYSNEDWNITVSRYLGDYPLLSQIIKEKKCDKDVFNNYRGRELRVIITEYNNWIEKRKNGMVTLTDTTASIKGLLDANKYFNPKYNFFLNFFINGLFTPLVGLPVALISGFTDPIFISTPHKELKKDLNYLRAYKARAFTMKNTSAAKGHLCGYGLLLAVLIARSATHN